MMNEENAHILDELLSILANNMEEDEFDRIIDILYNAGVFHEHILDELLSILGDYMEEDEFDRIIDILDNAGVFKEDDDE